MKGSQAAVQRPASVRFREHAGEPRRTRARAAATRLRGAGGGCARERPDDRGSHARDRHYVRLFRRARIAHGFGGLRHRHVDDLARGARYHLVGRSVCERPRAGPHMAARTRGRRVRRHAHRTRLAASALPRQGSWRAGVRADDRVRDRARGRPRVPCRPHPVRAGDRAAAAARNRRRCCSRHAVRRDDRAHARAISCSRACCFRCCRRR